MLTPVTPLPEGHRLFEYRVLGVLGQGGFGTTYLCLDQNLQNKCVVKEFTPHAIVRRAKDGRLKERGWSLRSAFASGRDTFLTEARTLAKFIHPNIVRVRRYFEENNTAYFVMDYEFGRNLRDLIRNRRNFTEEEIMSVITPICDGLEQLHDADLIHRDIKPENIVVRPDGSPALIDFGAAADFRNANGEEFDVIASPAYAPIEQFDPQAAQGPWTDIYALGAVVYEMIAGNPPTPSLKRGGGSPIQAASEVGRGRYSNRLLGLVDKCLSLNFIERPKSTREFKVLLELNNDHLLRLVIQDTSLKMVSHFANWARPNHGLDCDELVAFTICFPIIDLSWRIGQGAPDKATFKRLYKLMRHDILATCLDVLAQQGFRTSAKETHLSLVEARLDEYAAAYLLDRQEDEWRYKFTLGQIARNCIAASHAADIPTFTALVEDVIDRARGRVKKEYNKAFRNVIWRKTPDGWIAEIVRFAGSEVRQA